MNKATNVQDINLIEGQLIASIFLLFGVGLSILLIYDSLEKAKKKEGFFSQEEAYQLLIIYRTSFVIIFGYLVYNNYQNFQISSQKTEDLTPLNLQLLSAILAFSAALIPLYTDLTYPNESIVAAEEPTF